MRTVLIAVLVSVVVLDIVIISRAVAGIRLNRRLRAQPPRLDDPLVERRVRSNRKTQVAPAFRWLDADRSNG
jgi:hypothetical protein